MTKPDPIPARATFTIGAAPKPDIRPTHGNPLTEGLAPTMSHAEVAAKIRANLPNAKPKE